MLFSPYYAKKYAGIIDTGLLYNYSGLSEGMSLHMLLFLPIFLLRSNFQPIFLSILLKICLFCS